MQLQLDDLIPKKKKRLFSIISFLLGVLNLLLFIQLIPPAKVKANEALISPKTPLIADYLLIGLLLGIIATVLCLLRKESITFFKIAGIALNTLILLVVIIAVAFYLSVAK